jgi:uncharacterized protein with FMN-binding domain
MKKYTFITITLLVLSLSIIVYHETTKRSGYDISAKSTIYKDGTYAGSVENAIYGNLQVAAVISGGKLIDITPLQYPKDTRTSMAINTQALPLLKEEALRTQNASVDLVSGASDTSPAFARSLKTALDLAKK